jgi:hypothetical protein
MHEESLLGLSAHHPYGSPGSTMPFDKPKDLKKASKPQDSDVLVVDQKKSGNHSAKNQSPYSD